MDKMEHRSAISVSYAVYHLSTSGIAVSTATAVTHPLDVLKVRLQMQLIGQKGPLTGMGKLFAQTMKTEGPRALYLGLGPSLTRSVIYGGLRLGLYEPCKYVCDLTFGSTNILVKIASGAFSGAIATALTNPMEVLKVRLQMNSNLGRGSAIREMRGIASEEGIKGLWKGVGPAMARAAALTASQLATYDESKQDLKTGKMIGGGHESNGLYHLKSGTIGAGATLQTNISPHQWHSRLGHPSLTNLRNLVPFLSYASKFECEACELSKHHRVSFLSHEDKVSDKPFYLIHLDVWVPIHISSLFDFNYFYLCE
ncbi:uncharacterized protein LOC131230739 isoform X3 [Magnolia sinica]|nr:uncharacterized protein LOC131230739 isoform X3 [Magnolia sinica]